MISFSTLGTRSRLGNHLFQYAFLRSTAQRLNVSFYCPKWAGDDIFDLDDRDQRETTPRNIINKYEEPYQNPGFNPKALEITDHTEIQGYFQTSRYLDEQKTKEWFSFNEAKVARAREKYTGIDFSNSVGLHIRLGDFVSDYSNLYYVARSMYYKNALEMTPRRKSMVVFSDQIPLAKKLLGSLGQNATYIEGNEAYEDLYLQTQCRDFICSPSTFSWWGGWLNGFPDKVIVAPSEGPFRPGAPIANSEFWPETWQRTRALNPVFDSHDFYTKRRSAAGKIRKIISLFK